MSAPSNCDSNRTSLIPPETSINVAPTPGHDQEDSEEDSTDDRFNPNDDEDDPSYNGFSDEDDSFQRELDAELDLQISEMMNETSRHIEQELQRQIDEQFQNQLDDQMDQYFAKTLHRTTDDASPSIDTIQGVPSKTPIPVKKGTTVKDVNKQIQNVIDQYKGSLKLQDD